MMNWKWVRALCLGIVVAGMSGAGAHAEDSSDYFIGHRYYAKTETGWGWVKKSDDGWNRAKWIALKERPPTHVAPFRKLAGPDADQDVEYKLWGTFADYKAYDPHTDEMVDVFILDHYEVIGPAEPLKRSPGPDERFARHKKSGAGSRSDRPILTPGDGDGF